MIIIHYYMILHYHIIKIIILLHLIKGIYIKVFFLFIYFQPVKIYRARGQQYNAFETRFNNCVKHDRIVVENWFSRHKNIFKIFKFWYIGDLEKFNPLYHATAILTNIHIHFEGPM